MGSTRFPGKMLEPLEGRPLLQWVIERVERAREVDKLVIATTERDIDDPLEELARGLGVPVFRGSEPDVLDRFDRAARAHGAATVARVCADNPLVAPEALDLVVSAFLERDVHYAFNHVPRLDNGWPDGLGAEVMGAAVLEDLAGRATDTGHREHVTAYIWDHVDDFRILAVPCPEEWRDRGDGIRLDVDRPEDLAFLSALCRGLAVDAGVPEILARWRSMA